jgi:hypothetical protein
LDGDTLTAIPGEAGKRVVGDIDLRAGPHTLVIRAPGYRDLAPIVTVVPRTNLEPSYQLEKQHRRRWYYGGATLAAIAGTTVALTAGKGKTTAAPEPLPGPPGPPSR